MATVADTPAGRHGAEEARCDALGDRNPVLTGMPRAAEAMATVPAPSAVARVPGMVSVVVPAHDEARLIGSTLDALAAALGALDAASEVIVVDDASTDATAAIALARGARVLPVRLRHIAATRNAGAAAARGDTLVFVDADTQVDGAVLRAALAALAAGAVGGGAAVRLQPDAARHAHWGAACFAWLFRLAGIAPGCFVFCTRAAFDAVGGFDTAYYAGEDVAISRALARQGRFVVLREAVRTSDRKLRTFSVLDQLRLFARFAWRGRALLRSRDGLELWYGERDHGPDGAPRDATRSAGRRR